MENPVPKSAGSVPEKPRDMAAVFVREGDKMLVVHNIKKGLRVEPPGGKQDPGETPRDCAARETLEELGAKVEVGDLFYESPTHSPEGPFRVRLYFAKIVGGVLEIKEPAKHGRVEYCGIEELRAYAKRGVLVPNLADRLELIGAELARPEKSKIAGGVLGAG